MPLKLRLMKSHKLSLFQAVAYRIPLPVVEIILYKSGCSYPICPRCRLSLEREYMEFCDRCGQHLSWELFDCSKIIQVSS